MVRISVLLLVTLSFISCASVQSKREDFKDFDDTVSLTLLTIRSDSLKAVCSEVIENLFPCFDFATKQPVEVIFLEASLIDLNDNTLEADIYYYFMKGFFYHPESRYQGVIELNSNYLFVPYGNNNFWFEYTDETVEFKVADFANEGSKYDYGCTYRQLKGSQFITKLPCGCE